LHAKILFYPLSANPLQKPKPVDFSNLNVAMAVETSLGNEHGPTAYFLTRDKGYTWKGPHLLHDPVFETIQARPSYVLRSDGLLLWFVQGRRWDEMLGGNKLKMKEDQ
jgi:hypothetical protein